MFLTACPRLGDVWWEAHGPRVRILVLYIYLLFWMGIRGLKNRTTATNVEPMFLNLMS